MADPQRPGAVVGENLKRRRELLRLTQGEVAGLFRDNGLDWSEHVVAAFESGRREDVTLRELVFVSSSLAQPIVELFAGDGDVLLGPDQVVRRDQVRSWLSGETPLVPMTPEQQKYFRVDYRIAERLGIDSSEEMDVAEELWGKTASEEHENRVLEREEERGDWTPAWRRTMRGHVTRELLREMERALELRRALNLRRKT
jgi:transcriptional regulator with XRE-family HTH domain